MRILPDVDVVARAPESPGATGTREGVGAVQAQLVAPFVPRGDGAVRVMRSRIRRHEGSDGAVRLGQCPQCVPVADRLEVRPRRPSGPPEHPGGRSSFVVASSSTGALRVPVMTSGPMRLTYSPAAAVGASSRIDRPTASPEADP